MIAISVKSKIYYSYWIPLSMKKVFIDHMKIKMLANFLQWIHVILLAEFLTLIKYLFLGINEAQKVADIRKSLL